ncbi:FK506-binding protein 2 [Fusarium bulbicola]|nr:FK506-binding protein 2 [Fusarium bulbicola]
MKTALFLSANDSAAVGIMAEDLKIESTLLVICGGTEKGNGDQMYYRDTLKNSGKQFSESAQRLVNAPCPATVTNSTLTTFGYGYGSARSSSHSRVPEVEIEIILPNSSGSPFLS